MITPSYDIIIIGAGLLGLSTARALLLKDPSLKVAVLEKESSIAMHQSGRNSGVIHSGIYYKPGSEKAKMCMAGASAMYQYCLTKGVPVRKCGKVIVATREKELPRLQNLYQRGQENGVKDLQWLDSDGLQQIEPYCSGIAAVLSPHTGIVDFMQVAHAYAEDAKQMGCDVITSFCVDQIYEDREEVVVVSQDNTYIGGRALINCAGVYVDRLAQKTKGNESPKIIPFRGDYLLLKRYARHRVNGLIYPVPDPEFPFLGVHFTPQMDGAVWLGPNAVLAFAREGYRFKNFSWKDMDDVFRYSGFRKLVRKHWKVGLGELYRDLFKSAYVKELRRYMPLLQDRDCYWGPSGIRAQALRKDGTLEDDFVFESTSPKTLHIRNAPSPAATSSLVIGDFIANKVFQELLAV